MALRQSLRAMTSLGPLRTLNVGPFVWAVVAAKGRPGGARRATEAVVAALRLPCAARVHGPAHNSLRSLRSLRSNRMRQVSLRSALRARAMNPALLGASHARRAPPGRPFAAGSGCSRRPPPLLAERQAVPGGGAVCGAEQRSLEGGERSELRQLTCRILFERSERSERSELCGTPSRRAGEPGHEQSGGLFVPGERPVRKDRRGLQGQGSLSAAKTATVSAPAGYRLTRSARNV